MILKPLIDCYHEYNCLNFGHPYVVKVMCGTTVITNCDLLVWFFWDLVSCFYEMVLLLMQDKDVEMKDASVISAEKQTAKKSEKKTVSFTVLFYV